MVNITSECGLSDTNSIKQYKKPVIPAQQDYPNLKPVCTAQCLNYIKTNHESFYFHPFQPY